MNEKEVIILKILSLDTSSNICSVCILEDTTVILEKHIEDEKTHSQKLMPLIDEILSESKLALSDFDLFVCCTGPGSFTGVRIGVSTVKAFHDVTDIPIASVSSLESLAYNTIQDTPSIVCSILDAKNDNVYYGIFEKKENTFVPLEELGAKNINDMISTLEAYHSSPILLVGDGAKKHLSLLTQVFSNATLAEDIKHKQSAISIGIAGFYHYKKGDFSTDSNAISPLYLRKSQAERALEGEK